MFLFLNFNRTLTSSQHNSDVTVAKIFLQVYLQTTVKVIYEFLS